MDKIPYAERVRLLAEKMAPRRFNEENYPFTWGNSPYTFDKNYWIKKCIPYAEIAVAEMAEAFEAAYMLLHASYKVSSDIREECRKEMIKRGLMPEQEVEKMKKIPYASRVSLLAEKFAMDDCNGSSRKKIKAGNMSTSLNQYYTTRVKYNKDKARIAVAEMAEIARNAYINALGYSYEESISSCDAACMLEYLREQGLIPDTEQEAAPMTYNERVRAIAEEMAEADAMELSRMNDTNEKWEDIDEATKSKWIAMHMPGARIAVRHMAEQYDEGFQFGVDYQTKSKGGLSVCQKMIQQGLIL